MKDIYVVVMVVVVAVKPNTDPISHSNPKSCDASPRYHQRTLSEIEGEGFPTGVQPHRWSQWHVINVMKGRAEIHAVDREEDLPRGDTDPTPHHVTGAVGWAKGPRGFGFRLTHRSVREEAYRGEGRQYERR